MPELPFLKRCDTCDSPHAICGGQLGPTWCQPDHEATRERLGRFWSHALHHKTVSQGPPPPEGITQVWGAALQAGAERAMLAILKATAKTIPWKGVAVLHAHDVHPRMLEEIQAIVPISLGEAAIRDAYANSQAIVTWGVHGFTGFLPEGKPRPKIVEILHAPGEAAWPAAWAQDDHLTDAYVGVCPSALSVIPVGSKATTTVIPNIIDWMRLRTTRTRDETREQLGIKPDQLALGFYGRCSSEKCPEKMLDAISCLPEEWVAVFVGQYATSNLEYASAVKAVHHRCRFLDPRDDAGDILRAFDVVMVPSKYESFGLTIAETLAVGTPLVASNVGILKDYPQLWNDAAVVMPGDAPDSLAWAVTGAKGMRANAGKKHIRDSFSTPAIARQWEDLLLPLIGLPVPAEPVCQP